MKKTNMIRIAGMCGVIAPVIFFVSIQIAIFDAPWFEWTQNALSELGVQGTSALFFNNGLVLVGILFLIFSLGLSRILSRKIGAYLLGFSSLALMGVGLFPLTLFEAHYISSAVFFLFLMLAILMIGLTLKQNQFDKKLGIIAILFALFACVSPIFLNVFNGIAIPEAIVCFPAFIWCMLYGFKMAIKEGREAGS